MKQDGMSLIPDGKCVKKKKTTATITEDKRSEEGYIYKDIINKDLS